jgi:L-fucose isomerase-like protein
VDLPALLGVFVQARLAGAPAFDFDITAYLEDEGAIQLAHCGAAAPQLAAEGVRPVLRSHMRTGTGATLEFPFKTGPATLAKLMRPTGGKLQFFVAEGEVIPTENARGSVATFRPRTPLAAFMDTWIREAVEHHASLVYGHRQRDLELFCEFTGMECVSG